MDGTAFRSQLRQLLEENRGKVLLRIALGPDLAHPIELTGGEILERSQELANRLTVAAPSQVVLLLLPHSLELFLLHFGLILTGRLPAILAWPTTRIDPEKYQRNLLHQLRNLPAHQLITLPMLAENLAPGLPYPAVACDLPGAAEFEKGLTTRVSIHLGDQPEPVTGSGVVPADALFLQFSGGTTGAQKAVVVTAPMLTDQLARLREILNYSANDGVASWLPMYHDMGLIACLWFPLWHATPSVQFSASDWLLKPDMLFRYLERYGATFCWLPNFAFSYLATLRARMKDTHSLGHVRGFVNCSEPVRLRSMRAFAETFAEWGVTMEALQASYAMAENVFAVTQTELGKVPATFPRSRLRHRAVQPEEHAFDLIDDVYVSSGRTLNDMQVRIVNEAREILGDAQPGEIQLRTGSMFSGYWGKDGFITTSLTEDGWYSTGDYGFIESGELYVIGRFKDIIIVGGQNVFPEDIEVVVNSVEGIYPGRVVSFGIQDAEYGTEAIAVVAELRGAFEEQAAKALERQIHKLVVATVGISPRYVAVVPERWIVKSTAGKISRRDTRQRFIQERIERSQAV